MLIADNLTIAGRHLPLLDPTSFAVARGELLLVQAEPQSTRTALALAASARMRPDGGTVSWSGVSALKAIRKISALVDSPAINEPEAHVKVRDLVAEDLALHPGSFWRRTGTTAWIKKHHMNELADKWLDAIDPLQRLTLLTHLALEDRNVELLVFDTPDRHGVPEDDWCDFLQTVATGRRAPAIVAVLQRMPENWRGSTAYAGEIQEKLVVQALDDSSAPDSESPEPSEPRLETADTPPPPKVPEDAPCAAGTALASAAPDPDPAPAPTPAPAGTEEVPTSGASTAEPAPLNTAAKERP